MKAGFVMAIVLLIAGATASVEVQRLRDSALAKAMRLMFLPTTVTALPIAPATAYMQAVFVSPLLEIDVLKATGLEDALLTCATERDVVSAVSLPLQ